MRVNLRAIAWRIEYHWFFIMRHRKKGNRMISRGEPLTSAKLINLSRRLNAHGFKAMRLQAEYERITATEEK